MSESGTNAKSTTVVIFGGSGDLTHRKLGPALFRLFLKGRLPDDFRIVGFAHTAYSDEQFRSRLEDGVRRFTNDFAEDHWRRFAARIFYVEGNFNDPNACGRLVGRLNELEEGTADRLYYLAIAPRFFGPAIALLGRAGMADAREATRNLVIEKPFGTDRASALQLTEAAHSVFAESQIYRIDHYLGKETAQNLLYFRFANTIFEPLWNRSYIDNVQISVTESVDVGTRAGYYDQAGVLRDMFQNHLLQLFTLVALEPPAPYDGTTLRNEKVKVLNATQSVAIEDAVFAQYAGYADTDGVSPGSTTPTFAALKLEIDNWRWQGVPFYLRSGKALHAKGSTISVEFKRPPHQMFGAFQSPNPNVLSLCIQPDEGVHLQFEAKVPDQSDRTESVDLAFHYQDAFAAVDLPDAYERLILDALGSDPALFARSDEIDEAWQLMDPVIVAQETGTASRLGRYERGAVTVDVATDLLARDGRSWHVGCAEHG